MKQSDLKELIKECYKEVLAEEYEPDYSEYSNDALTDMIINLSRYEGNEDIIGMVKDELKKRKQQSKTIQEKMKQSQLKALIKECYREVLAENDSAITKPLDDKIQKDPSFLKKLQDATKAAEKGNTTDLALMMSGMMKENEEMDLPADTGKNINMGFDNTVGLDVDKRMSGNMSKVMSQIEMLKNKLAPFIADFKSKKLSKEQYMEATKGLVADLKKAQMALELMMAKL
jgi:ribosomal protein S20